MYSEVSSIFTRAERLWLEIFKAKNDDLNSLNPIKRDEAELSAKRHRNWTEEDFLWCWQHRGFW